MQTCIILFRITLNNVFLVAHVHVQLAALRKDSKNGLRIATKLSMHIDPKVAEASVVVKVRETLHSIFTSEEFQIPNFPEFTKVNVR